MSKGSLHTLLLAALDEAANSKDQVEQRASQLSSVLALLMECHSQPWFGEAVSDQIKRTYPKPYRCLLDAVLQAFVAVSPLHCGPVLQGFMRIPGCITLNSPFRRDLAALFKAPAQLQSCWPRQGVVVCSIVTCLATAASTQLWQLSQQKQSLEAQQQLHQEFGTSLSWLVDCLLHALPSQLLSLMQLILAEAVFYANKQEAAQQEGQSHLAVQCSTPDAPPPAKRPRLGQPQQQQQEAEAASSVSSTLPSQQAIQLGMQLLTAVCCCEHVQHSSRRLVPYAAAAAASTAVGTTEQAVVAVCHGRWLYRHLCSHVTAVPAGSSTAPSTATASTTTSSLGARQQLASDALQPYTALAHVLRQLSDHSPVLVLDFVRLIMGLPQNDVTQSAVAQASGRPATTAASLTKSDSVSGSISSLFLQHLTQAARQWLPVAEPAPGQSKKQKGKNSCKQQQQQKPTAPQQQVLVQGNVSSSGSRIQGPILPSKHVLPDTSNVNAAWVCKHVVPILVQATHEQWLQQQQQHQQALELDPSVKLPTAAEALVHLLSAEGMLLPAAGEVLVSARVLAENLNSLQADLQSLVAQRWRRQQQAVAGAAAAEAAAGTQQPGCLVAWKVLQPMLCLLSSLEMSSPFAALLVECVQHCIDSSSAALTTAANSTSASTSSARGILQHILLPVRFGLKMPARIWLLLQLLTTQQHLGRVAVDNIAAAAGVTSGAPLAVGGTDVEGINPLLTVLINTLKTDWQKQLAQGLQLLAKQQQQQGMPGGKSGVVSLQQMELAAALTGLLRELESRCTVVGCAVALPIEGDWQLQVANQLRVALQAADAAAYDAIMLGDPLETCAQ